MHARTPGLTEPHVSQLTGDYKNTDEYQTFVQPCIKSDLVTEWPASKAPPVLTYLYALVICPFGDARFLPGLFCHPKSKAGT